MHDDADIDGLLAAIDARERKFAPMTWRPASPEAIERLRRFARDTLRTDLPEGYVKFLGRTDGLAFNNCEIYAATERKKPYMPGFAETNEILVEGGKRYVFYGGTPDELYAQARTSGAWVELDAPSLDVIATFPSFDAMLARVLRDAIEGVRGPRSTEKV